MSIVDTNNFRNVFFEFRNYRYSGVAELFITVINEDVL